MAKQLPAITLSENDGVRHLHFGNEWIQGSMRLSRPDKLELEYAQQMMAWLLFLQTKSDFKITQLGLGTGALSKFCHQYLPKTKVAAVDINPAVVVAARTMFYLPPDDRRLQVLIQDAKKYVRDLNNHHSIDALQIDLYGAQAQGPAVGGLSFYRACRKLLRSPGMLSVNLFANHPSFTSHLSDLERAFAGRVLCLPPVHDGNIVALAFNGPPLSISKKALLERAAIIQSTLALPAKKWVQGLFAANHMGTHLCV